MRDAVRVALLARPGAGSDRLREALQAAGADLVLDADPTTLDPATLSGAGAESVVVLLDAAVEDALDRLDPVLHDPAIDVLYEESEVAAAREGWDVARWTRHLSAKLLRHGDVLPPGREADAAPSPAAAPAPTASPASPAAAPAPTAPSAGPAPSLADEHALAPPGASELPPPAAEASPASMFDPVSAEYEPAGDEPASQVPASQEPAESDAAAAASEPPEFEPLEFTPSAPADPVAEAGTAASPAELPSIDLPAESPPAEGAPTPGDVPLTLSLEGDEEVPSDTAAEPRSPPNERSDALRDFRRDLASIEQRIASMDLVDADPPAADASEASAPESLDLPSTQDTPVTPDTAAAAPAPAAATAAGAVLVFAGIGGPDAVRQFLGALPPGFPRPVLIHQRLDGGRHDRLVQQLARATSLPVQLAADGEAVAGGHVYILPPGLGLDDGTTGLRFVEGGDPMATLPPGESAVLMFSGSDTGLVEAAMGHAQAGALVAGQSPEDCYDAAASDALVARGAESGQPADLARRLADRWAA